MKPSEYFEVDQKRIKGVGLFFRQSMVSVSAKCRPLYRLRYPPIVVRYVDHHLADISVDTSVDMSTDISRSFNISAGSWSVCQTDISFDT